MSILNMTRQNCKDELAAAFIAVEVSNSVKKSINVITNNDDVNRLQKYLPKYVEDNSVKHELSIKGPLVTVTVKEPIL